MEEKIEKNVFFLFVKKIFDYTESYILGYAPGHRVESWFLKRFWFPFKYIFKGGGELFWPFMKWSWMFLASFVAMTYIVKENQTPQFVLFLAWLCAFIPMFLVMFSLPSTYAYYGVKPKHINDVVDYIEQQGIASVELVDLFEKCLEKIKERVAARVSAFKWVVGVGWALFTFTTNLEIGILLRKDPSQWVDAASKLTFDLFGFVFFSVIAITLVFSYKRASDLLVKTLEYSALEIKFRLKAVSGPQFENSREG